MGLQDVPVVHVQRVERSRLDFVLLVGFQIRDYAGSLIAVDCLQVVLVPHLHFQAGREDGFVHGESHVVALQQEAKACPPRRALYLAFRTLQILDIDNFHHRSAVRGSAIAQRLPNIRWFLYKCSHVS